MLKPMIAQIEVLTFKQLLQFELLIATTLPVAALLVFAIAAITHTTARGMSFFVITFVICTITATLGEVITVRLVHYAFKKRILELAAVCRDHVSGDTSRRAWARGKDELAVLARSLNTLLGKGAGKAPTHKHDRVENTQHEQYVNEQLERLLRQISPIIHGDLRVQAEATSDVVGVVAGIFNYLVDELRALIGQFQFAPYFITNSSSDLLDRTVALARHLEVQTTRLARTTETLEAIFVSMQRITRMLQLSEAGMHKIWDALRSQEESALLENLRQQLQMIGQASKTAQESTSNAENMILDFYALSENAHQSGQCTISIAERIGGLTMQAEQWSDAVSHFQLPEPG